MRPSWIVGWLALAACSSGSERVSSGFESMDPEGCTPGEQRACACPAGAPDGVQVCADGGDHFEACLGCDADGVTSTSPGTVTAGGTAGGDASESGPATSAPTSSDASAGSSEGEVSSASGSSGEDVGPCANHCNNGVTDCGEPHTDCGGDCPEVPYYTWCDCMIDTPRNGSEICDDTGFQVPADSPPGVLVCLEATGGQIYIAKNTSIDPNDKVQRCSGWELMGQNAWDHLDYIVPALTCDAEQKTQPFDISGYAGQTLWFGAHNHPNGGGNGTTACIAIAK